MKQEVKQGQTDYTVIILIRDTDGAPKTGLTNASAGLDVSYVRVETDNDVVVTAGAPVALATPALTDVHLDWGFLEIDATNHPGLYRLDVADGVFASGAWSAVVTLIGTGLDPTHIEFILVPVSPYDGVSVNAITAGAITAAAIANAAIDNATFAADVGSTAYATNIIALAVRKVLDEIKLDHLVAIADADDVVDDSIIGKLASTDGDWSKFSETTDSLQSIRDVAPHGTAMRGTDGANVVVPDAAGVAAALHAITDALIGGLVVPDVAGTAAALHTITDAAIAGLVVPDVAGTAAALHAITDAAIATRGTADPGDDMGLTAAGVDAVLDEVTELGITLRQAIRVIVSYVAGEANGGGTATINFRDLADTLNRIQMTVDADGNRSAVVLNLG